MIETDAMRLAGKREEIAELLALTQWAHTYQPGWEIEVDAYMLELLCEVALARIEQLKTAACSC